MPHKLLELGTVVVDCPEVDHAKSRPVELPVIWLDSEVRATVPASIRGPHVDLHLFEILHLEVRIEGTWCGYDQLLHTTIRIIQYFWETFRLTGSFSKL